MIRFTYSSGKEVEYDYDWAKLAPKLQLGGLRLFSPEPGVLIPLNSNTIAIIEDITPDEEDEIVEEKQEVDASPVGEDEEDTKNHDDVVEDPEKKLSIEEKKEKIIAEMKEMSACAHEKHDIYYQEIMTGRGANRKSQKRFFPVCAKCGVRERYVKAADLSKEQIENAKIWDK